jgi:hypothetical protein
MSQGSPVIFEINPVNGQVVRYFSLEKEGSITYKTFGAVIKYTQDDMPFYEVSFIMNDSTDVLVVAKINLLTQKVTETHKMALNDTTTEPKFMFQSLHEPERTYVLSTVNN